MINITAKLSEAPLGFEYTGEFRSARENEYFVDDQFPGKLLFWDSDVPSFGDYWILRKKKMGTEELRQRLEEVEKQVYGLRTELTKIEAKKDECKAPKGFKFTGEVRIPNKGEWFRDKHDLNIAHYHDGLYDAESPRKILQKLKRFVFEETGEIRVANKGEFYCYHNLSNLPLVNQVIFRALEDNYITDNAQILRLVEENANPES